eukprot:PITA_28547
MPREKDFAWAYCHKILGDPKLLCKFCKVKCSGGIYRFKYHLAQIPGHDIGLFKNVDKNVKHQETSAIDMLSRHNAKKEKQKNEIGTLGVDNFSSTTPLSSSSIESSMQFPGFPHMPPSPIQTQGKMNPPTFNIEGGNIKALFFSPHKTRFPTYLRYQWLEKDIHGQARKTIAKLWYYSDIPFHYAISPYWKAMIDAIVVAGPGFKAPSSESIMSNLLLESVGDVKLVLSKFCSSWVEIGHTIMSDGWTYQRNKTLINVLVSCPVGTMFLKSVDASDKVKTTQLIFEMMEEVIQEMGEEHVVQIVTDNAANYMDTGKLFEIRHLTIFWTYCVAHCIGLILEDIGKIRWIHEVVEKEKSITKYLYKHTIVLNTMIKYTEAKEIVQPVVIRFETNFISFFWKDAKEIIAMMESLVRVLRMVDSDKPVMGYIYEVMDLASEAIERRYGDEEERYMPLWDIIDASWDRKLHSPLHVARYFLNPQRFYDKEKVNEDGEVCRGLLTCIERCFPDPKFQSHVFSQL